MIDLTTFTVLDTEAYENNKNSELGILPSHRDLKSYIERGFIILDKPAGPTSHDVVATVKKILDVNKAGHAGTLDPGVSGVLPIALEEGTKILTLHSGATKTYICNLHLHQEVDINELKQTLNEFTGQIYQFPPLKSNVVRRLRKRTIYDIKLIEKQEQDYLLEITCEAGTYIRTLCIDIGKVIGVGGEMKELRRVKSSIFDEAQTVTLHDLFDAYQDAVEGISEDNLRQVIKPVEAVLSHIPAVIIRDNAVGSISHGAKLAIPGIIGYQEFSENQDITIMTCKGELVAIAKSLQSSEVLQKEDHGYIAQPQRVIFKRDEYQPES